MRQWFIDSCNPTQFDGTLSESMVNADIFIGVSTSNVLNESDIKSMASEAIVFALSNPDPEIDPSIARKYAAVVATGRSDQPNQINNVLAFPGIFRGLLDIGASKITPGMLKAASQAIANCVTPEQLNHSYIIPSVFDQKVSKSVAEAILSVSQESR
jgi:malate dehydrogenase (oxaloacetate-decarboxylating)